jgi:MOSC domain-containing protein YiiM
MSVYSDRRAEPEDLRRIIGYCQTMVPVLDSVQVGQPVRQEVPEPWVTAFYKHAVSGPVRLSRTGLIGDQQADLTVHGGPDKAVCVYAGEHYGAWHAELGDPCGPGWCGENFTVRGQVEATVAIGDTFQIGTARVQVSQPRSPCWKLARRWNRLDMVKRVVDSGRTGWYLRVLEQGEVEAGDELHLIDRPFAHLTIALANDVMYARVVPERAAHRRAELAACPALSDAWRSEFREG